MNQWDNNKLVIAVITCQIEYKIVQNSDNRLFPSFAQMVLETS